jgi:CRP-like cAMP-binding protein
MTSNDPSDGPLLRRASRFVQLSPEETRVLSEFGAHRRPVAAGDALVVEGEPSDDLFILQSGRMLCSTLLADGERQILRLHHPGDLMNITCLTWSRTSATVAAMIDSEVSAIPRTALTSVFLGTPRLAALFYGLSIVDNVVLADRLKMLGRTDGRGRIAGLLLELLSRQRLTEPDGEDTVELYLTQSQIADTVGVTKVHVNRLLRELTEDGLIAREGRRVHLRDRNALVALSAFVDRHAELETDWYPPSADDARIARRA